MIMFKNSAIFLHHVFKVSIEHRACADGKGMELEIGMESKEGQKGTVYIFLDEGTEPSWPVEIQAALGKKVKIGKLIFQAGEKERKIR